MWDYVLLCGQLRKRDWSGCQLNVCLDECVLADVTDVRRGKWGYSFHITHFVALGFLLCELLWEVCKVKGLLVKRLRKWIQSERLPVTLLTATSFLTDLKTKQKKKEEKSPVNHTSYLVFTRMDCSRQLYCVLLLLWTGAGMLLRPLIRRAPLQIQTETKMSLEQRGEFYLINLSSWP